MRHKSYDTVTEAMTELKEIGYTNDFSISREDECLICNLTSMVLSPDDFDIDDFYRFEGGSDPRNQMIIYAISSKINDLKGILVNAYGIYSDNTTSEIVKKLNAHPEHGIIDIIDKIITYDKNENSKEKDSCIIDTCPVCWGYQQYNGKIIALPTDKQIDVNNHSGSYSFIQEFVKTNIDGIKLKEGEVKICPKCGSKNNEG